MFSTDNPSGLYYYFRLCTSVGTRLFYPVTYELSISIFYGVTSFGWLLFILLLPVYVGT